MTRAYRRRLVAIWLTVGVAVALLAAAVLVRLREAPEPARLLPDSDGILYANLKPVRAFTDLSTKPDTWSADYRIFVEQTGFEFGRDLDQMALAMHVPADPTHETRYSEVMVGRFDSAKIADFLNRRAGSRESYRNQDIFLIPYEDRTVRVAVLSLDMVAASNTGDPAQIDHIIDSFRRSVFAAKGSDLLRRHYHDVPFGSLAWLITEVASPKAVTLSDNISPLPFVRQLFGGGVVVGSVRYNGSVILRADDYLSDAATAKDHAEQLQNLLSLYHITEGQTRPEHPDPDMDSVLNSLKVEQKNDRVEVSASLPTTMFKKMFAAPLENETAATPAPAAASKAPSRKLKRHRR